MSKVSRKRGVKKEEAQDPVKAMASEDLFDLAYGVIDELRIRGKEDPTVRDGLNNLEDYFDLHQDCY